MGKHDAEVVIDKMEVGIVKVYVRGLTPLIYNAMSAKARHELLFPSGRKTSADKAQKLKHNPLDEYRNSVYRRSGDGPTRLIFPAAAFKSAMCNAALEIPGAKKAQIGRLLWVEGDSLDVYGAPKAIMSVVRSADMNHTPDVRTRAILSEWACMVSVRFVMPTMNATSVARLLATAGLVIGVGDFRQEKGKGNYGQFETANYEDVAGIIERGGMAAQDAALESPQFYDSETESLWTWFDGERVSRGR